MSPSRTKIALKRPRVKPSTTANFPVVRKVDVPHSRNGKHHQIVADILHDLEELEPGMAIQVPLADLKDTKERIRSAINRALAKRNIVAATASDDGHFYIWKK